MLPRYAVDGAHRRQCLSSVHGDLPPRSGPQWRASQAPSNSDRSQRSDCCGRARNSLQHTTTPGIGSTAQVGPTLTASRAAGIRPRADVQLRVEGDGTAVSGATGSSFTIPAALPKERLTVTASYNDNAATSGRPFRGGLQGHTTCHQRTVQVGRRARAKQTRHLEPWACVLTSSMIS